MWEEVLRVATHLFGDALLGQEGHSGQGFGSDLRLEDEEDLALSQSLVDDLREVRAFYNGSSTVSVSTAILIVLAISAAIGALLFAGYGFLFVDGAGKRSYSSGWEAPFILPHLVMGKVMDGLAAAAAKYGKEEIKSRTRQTRRNLRRCLSLVDEMELNEGDRRHLRGECREAYY